VLTFALAIGFVVYLACNKKVAYPLKFVGIFFWATVWNFIAKFHTLITCSFLGKQATQHLIFCYCCKVIKSFC